jgi:molybdopterin synthase sulfur carrier subunit
MTILIKYFASLREQIGKESETLELPVTGMTVAQLRQFLCERATPYDSALAKGRAVRVSVNFEMAGEQDPIPDGAEVAFFPPVTGG